MSLYSVYVCEDFEVGNGILTIWEDKEVAKRHAGHEEQRAGNDQRNAQALFMGIEARRNEGPGLIKNEGQGQHEGHSPNSLRLSAFERDGSEQDIKQQAAEFCGQPVLS